MRALFYISTFVLCSFFVKGQDNFYYWGNFLTDRNDSYRISETNEYENCFTIQNFYKKGGNWIESIMTDSICFENDSLILRFRKYQDKLFDSTKLTVKQQNDIYVIEEYYDNDILKFKAFSTSNYPFKFKGKAKHFYRNGKLYATYNYSENQIDSLKIESRDSTFIQKATENFNKSLQEKSFEIVEAIEKNLRLPAIAENSLSGTHIVGLCIEKGKISRIEILRSIDFENENAIIKALEQVEFNKILDSNISGCVIIPIHNNYE